MKIIKNTHSLYPIEIDGVFYYVRFIRRGSKLECSGVFKLFINDHYNGRIEPEFLYWNKDFKESKEAIKQAKEKYFKQTN